MVQTQLVLGMQGKSDPINLCTRQPADQGTIITVGLQGCQSC